MKNLQIGYLLDFYGGLLSQRRREILEWYYEDDLSLGEIAERVDMTRQGVRDHIKRAERELAEYEQSLNLAKRFKNVAELTEKVRDIAQDREDILSLLDQIDEIL